MEMLLNELQIVVNHFIVPDLEMMNESYIF